jgi:hypothetical protein
MVHTGTKARAGITARPRRHYSAGELLRDGQHAGQEDGAGLLG